jgi:hypothetical protein
MTARAVARASGLELGNARNLCCELAARGFLNIAVNTNGREVYAYTATVEVLPTDGALVRDLVDAYGSATVRRLVREAGAA